MARSELGVALDVPAEDVAHADVDEVERLLEALGLRAFSTPLRSKNHELSHGRRIVPSCAARTLRMY
jgi:hypothetical protein